jgi:hypothetical protein
VEEDSSHQFLVPLGVLVVQLSDSRGGVDGDIIHVDSHIAFIDEVVEYGVHHRLEHCQGIGQSKEYHVGFEQPFVGDEGGFPLVFLFDWYLIVPPQNVECGEFHASP